MKHLFIINPVAGGRSGAGGIEQEIRDFSRSLTDPVDIYLTKGPMDAARKISEEAETGEFLRIYACGGDGTLNECANGAAGKPNAAVSHYPCGTGNDFIKTFPGLSPDSFRDLNALTSGEVSALDIIECSLFHQGDVCEKRYGLNICSVGIDARVGTDVHKYSRIPLIGGATGYIISLIVNVIKGIVQDMHISFDGIISQSLTPGTEMAEFNKKLTLACACNGRYYGGGFNPVPDALTDDGILECLVVEPVSRLQVAKIVSRYAQGRFSEFPDVFNYVRCSAMSIEAGREFVVNIDGERAWAEKITFRLIPKGVNFIFPVHF